MSFALPQGMTGTDKTTHYELSASGGAAGVDACLMTLHKPIAKAGALAQQANDLLTQTYGPQGYEVLDDNYGTDLVENRTEGRSGQGWDYVELRAELRKGGPSDERGHVLLIDRGSDVVPVIGYSPTSKGCTQLSHDFKTGIVGEIRWRELAYSLEFANLTKSPLSVVGEWSLLQGASAQEYAFAANGRYGFWGALATERRVSQTELEVTTSNFTGVGAYVVQGDVLALFPDGKPSEAMYVRVFEQHAVSPSMEVSRQTRLGMMRRDVGGLYELPLVRK